MKFLRRKLRNGITVIMEKRELDVVSVSISNPFGAAFESSDVKGAAHVIEHMLFTGTKNRTHEDISREIEKRGGVLNAFTDHDVTSFWFKLPSEHIFAGLDVLCDMLNNPKFDSEKFEKEKKVILEEIKLYHDDPVKCVFDQIEKNLYSAPFGELIIGNSKSVSSLEQEKMKDIFKKNYAPGNFVVSIVGNANFDEICSFLEKNFKLCNCDLKPAEIKKKNFESVEKREGVDQANFVLGMHAPLPSEKGFKVLEILNSYLAGGMSSRLFLEIREKRGLAYAVKGIIRPGKTYCYYVIYVGTTEKALPEVKKIILEEFKKVDKMNEKDLQEAKESLIGTRRISSEESSNVMNELLYYELFTRAEDYYSFDNEIKKVKLSEVKELAREMIKSYSSAAVVPN